MALATQNDQTVGTFVELQKGPAQRDDAMALGGGFEELFNNILPAPQAICSIGMIMCISTKREIDLRTEGGALAKRIRNPQSFKSTMVQVAGDSCSAFQTAQTNMHALSLQMGEIPKYILELVTYLVNKDGMPPDQMTDYMTLSFQSLDKVTVKCLQLSRDTFAEFSEVGELLQEVAEKISARKRVSEEELRKAKQEYEIKLMNKDALKQQETAQKENFENLKSEAKKAQKDFDDVMAKAPGLGEMVKSAFADAACSMMRNLSHPSSIAVLSGNPAGMLAAGASSAGSGPVRVAPLPTAQGTSDPRSRNSGSNSAVEAGNMAMSPLMDRLGVVVAELSHLAAQGSQAEAKVIVLVQKQLADASAAAAKVPERGLKGDFMKFIEGTSKTVADVSAAAKEGSIDYIIKCPSCRPEANCHCCPKEQQKRSETFRGVKFCGNMWKRGGERVNRILTQCCWWLSGLTCRATTSLSGLQSTSIFPRLIATSQLSACNFFG